MKCVRLLVLTALAASLLLATGCKKTDPAPQSTPAVTASPSPSPSPSPTPEPTPEPTVNINAYGGYPKTGDELGQITIPGTNVDCKMYWGDSTTQLNKGAGTYTGGCMPGQGGTIISGAHTNTYFRDFENVKLGDEIIIKTYYGEYHYEVVDMKVANANDTSTYDLNAKEENLILYTCYPFGTLQHTDQRYFIYGKYISGPEIVEGEVSADSSAASAPASSNG